MKLLKFRKKKQVVFAAIGQVPNFFCQFLSQHANEVNFYFGSSLSMFTETKSMNM